MRRSLNARLSVPAQRFGAMPRGSKVALAFFGLPRFGCRLRLGVGAAISTSCSGSCTEVVRPFRFAPTFITAG